MFENQKKTSQKNNIDVPNIVMPNKRPKKKYFVFGFLLGVAALCSLFYIGFIKINSNFFEKEKAPITAMIDSFMQAMTHKDFETAFALFGPQVQNQLLLNDLEGMVTSNNFKLFEGYQKVEIRNMKTTSAIFLDQKDIKGIIYIVDGYIEYKGGYSGKLESVLKKIDGKWVIYGFNVTILTSQPY